MLESLERIEAAIRASDGEAIRARWEFGRQVIAQREGKQLPRGLSPEICRRAGISAEELSRRTRIAEAYSQTELSHLCESPGVTWTAIVNGLPRTKRASPKQPAKPRATPTANTVKDADRLEELIARPDVAAELKARETTSRATQRAQVTIERREREEAKRQKEQDQLNLQTQQILRRRLIAGDKDWLNLSEQTETFTDTVKRYVQLLDGLVVPNALTLKVLERHVGELQQTLMELRGRLWPDYREPSGSIATVSVINARSRDG